MLFVDILARYVVPLLCLDSYTALRYLSWDGVLVPRGNIDPLPFQEQHLRPHRSPQYAGRTLLWTALGIGDTSYRW